MTRYLIFILIGLLNFCSARHVPDHSIPCIPHLDVASGKEYYLYVDQMPEFPGGREELDQFFTANFTTNQSNEAGFTFSIEFIINAAGQMTDIVITQGIEESLDTEALRVLQAMPAWKPGECDGKPVAVKMSLILNVVN
jgi:periplasmic protein TonB